MSPKNMKREIKTAWHFGSQCTAQNWSSCIVHGHASVVLEEHACRSHSTLWRSTMARSACIFMIFRPFELWKRKSLCFLYTKFPTMYSVRPGSCANLGENPGIDLLPNNYYGPGTSKRYRKPVTTGNTVISNCEKRNFRRSSDLAEAKIYLFAVLVIFDMPSTDHFFWSFCSQVGITMVLEGFSRVFVFGRSALLYRDFDKVSDGLDLSELGWSFKPT